MRPHTSSPQGRFDVTPMTLWRNINGDDEAKTKQALAQLCDKYWAPLYTFVRRQGFSKHDAEDLTQGFMAQFIGQERYKVADPARGKFRTFLLTCLKNYMENCRRAASRQKRDPGTELISISENAEDFESAAATDENTPQLEYERKWAATVIEHTLGKLRAEMANTGKQELFLKLRPYLAGEKSKGSYGALAGELGMSEGSLRVTIHRLRQRYSEILREEIMQTVSSREEADEEIRHLLRLFSGERGS